MGSTCMCRQLYGKVDPELYLNIIEKPNPKNQDELGNYEKKVADAMKDAEAMGQTVLVEVLLVPALEREYRGGPALQSGLARVLLQGPYGQGEGRMGRPLRHAKGQRGEERQRLGKL